MKLTSAKKDYGIYGFMTAVFLVATIFFLIRYGFNEIWYLLLMVLFLLFSLYFLIGALRFRVTWGADGFYIRQELKPEKHYALDEFQQMYIEDQCIILYLGGKKYGFSQGCPHAMEFIEFLEETFPAEQKEE